MKQLFSCIFIKGTKEKSREYVQLYIYGTEIKIATNVSLKFLVG
jgi:hypothetical protein